MSKNDLLTDPFSYLTTWSLLISYSIFAWTLILGAPKWIFLFAACFITTTSILGTFFICIPNAKNEADKRKVTVGQVILEDSLVHTGPLVLFLVLFCFFSKRVVSKKMNNWDYGKLAFITFIVIFTYLGYIKFQQIYYYDYFTLVVLTVCMFVISFQFYLLLINK